MAAAATLSIQLENGSRIFYPGQVIRGQVTFVNETEIKVKGLTVTIFGEGEVYWTESEARTDTVSPHRTTAPTQNTIQRHVQREYKNQETYICEEIVLFGQRNEEGGKEHTIPPGIQTYQFSYQLPYTGLPSSYIGCAFGFVRYSIEARLKRPLFRYDKAEGEFYLNGILDLNFMPNVLQPYAANDRVDFGWLCCNEGYMTMDLSLDKTGYLPGERVEFKASLLNFSMNTARNIKAEFIQVTEFKTFDRRKRIARTIQEINFVNTIPAGGIERFPPSSFSLPSTLLPTNLAGCRIIEVSYIVLMSATTPDRNLCVGAPIIIGTEICPPPQPPPVASLTHNQRTNPHGQNQQRKENVTLLQSEYAEVKEINQNYAKQSTITEYDPGLNPFSETESVDDLTVLDNEETNSCAASTTDDNNAMF